jgi:ATP-dependent Lon protease
VRNVVGQFQQIVTESPTLSDELRTIAANIEEPAGWWILWRLRCPS